MYILTSNENGLGYDLGRFGTLQEAVLAAPRGGQPTQTGTHEWVFLPEKSPQTIVISRDGVK